MRKNFPFKPPRKSSETKNPVQKISLKNGWLFCPTCWIVLTPKEFKKSTFAGAVEVRNSPDGFPHFVWPTDTPPGLNFSDEEIKKVSDLCVKAYPDFQHILDAQIDLIEDPNHPGKILNLTQWERAVEVGYFHIYVEGLTENPLGYKPPYGAKIVPKKKKRLLMPSAQAAFTIRSSANDIIVSQTQYTISMTLIHSNFSFE